MKTSTRLFPILLLTLSTILPSCTDGPSTRGIGVYPGDPDAYDGPRIVSGGNTYRNLALGRVAYHSSSLDYNLTGHLLTDGIITAEEPSTFEAITNGERVERRLREKLLDDNFTSISFPGGGDASLRLSFGGGAHAGNVSIEGMCSLEPGKGKPSSPEVRLTLRSGEVVTLPTTPFIPTITRGGGSQDVSVQAGLKSASAPSAMPAMRGGWGNRMMFAYIADLPEGGEPFTDVAFDLGSGSVREWTVTEVNFFRDDREVSLLPSERFTSVWAPEGDEGGFVTVDLGADAKWDRVKIHYAGGTSAQGGIDGSPDGKTWTRVASFGKDEDDIPVKGKGRYVRLTIGQSAYVSELEVWGRGGVVPRAQSPRPYRDGVLPLGRGCWKLRRASEVQEEGEEISTYRYPCGDWLPATVPGTVAGSFLNAGAIPDMRYDDDQLQLSESFFNSDFWYRGDFTLPSSFVGKTLRIDFGGINWKADVFLNGTRLGRIEGAFRRESFDVTSLVREHNAIAVLIHRNDHPGVVKEQTILSTDNNGGVLGADNPTFHPTIGWDWIPTVRGRAIGIWDDVLLRVSAGVRISDPLVQTHLLSHREAEITPSIILTNETSSPTAGTLDVKVGDVEFSADVSLSPLESREITLGTKVIHDPALWWPNGYGEQNLTPVHTLFTSGDGTVSSSYSFRTGLREMTYTTDGGVLDIYVNGRRLIGNGGNWGFPEINLNYREREYDAAVAYHADMNFTMIRNWVGQTGDEEFYEACDKYGVMVWQDFWLANPSDGPDPRDNALFMDNATDYVRKIRRHPCLALYCGRNEGNPPSELDTALRSLVGKEHPGMFYIPHSAEGLVSGYGPYSALPPRTYFEAERGRDRLHSERGMPNVMTESSFRRMLREEHLWPRNSLWGMHDLTGMGAQKADTFDALLERKFGTPQSLSRYTELAQWINYEGYRAIYESRSWNRKGLVIWMSHSCWPSLVWQTYDYYLCPTGGYFGAKKGSAPLRIQWNPVLGRAEVVNDNYDDLDGARAVLQVLDREGKEVFHREDALSIKDDSTMPLERMDVDSTLLGKVYYHKFMIVKGSTVIADNFYVLGRDGGNLSELEDLPAAKVELKTRRTRDGDIWTLSAELRNTGSSPALMLHLDLLSSDGDQILPVIYEDNFFSLMPGEKKTVTVKCKARDTRGGKPHLALSGFNIART